MWIPYGAAGFFLLLALALALLFFWRLAEDLATALASLSVIRPSLASWAAFRARTAGRLPPDLAALLTPLEVDLATPPPSVLRSALVLVLPAPFVRAPCQSARHS